MAKQVFSLYMQKSKSKSYFEQVEEDSDLNNLIDDAYRKKYRDSQYLSPMIGNRARSATMKVIPRN